MKGYLKVFVLTILIMSCTGKPSPQYENGWHKAFVETLNGDMYGAMVCTKDGIIDSVCFSSGKCVGHFIGATLFEHSQNVQSMNDENNYTVYIIPDEWDQTKEMFQHPNDPEDEQYQ
jgi:hypothetical protein